MKKITLVLYMIAAFAFTADAQYYYLHFQNSNENPYGLNTDMELPNGLGPSGWIVLQANSAAAVWSPVANIPFAFSFNGTPVTQFKASTTGVVTFTTSAVPVPPAANTSLPAASVPANSICVWGLHAPGANDIIMTKTFGMAPNRQFWIQYNSYSIPGVTGSQAAYWGVVLQETTNNIFIVDQRTVYTNGSLTLSVGIQINSTTAYDVAASPNVGTTTLATSGNVDTPVDNAYYLFGYGAQPSDDARLLNLTNQIYIPTPGSANITGRIQNWGSAAITSIVIKYQSGANVYSYNASANIPSAGVDSFTHSTPLNFPSAATIPVTVWLELAGDTNQNNDTLNTIIYGTAFTPTKVVTIEEATGTWCGYCVRGTVYMDSIYNAYPSSVIPIAIHAGEATEPMRDTTYSGGIEGTGIGYPTIFVNRRYTDDPSEAFNQYNAHINDFGVANINVSVNYNTTTRASIATATVDPAIIVTGNYRLACVYTENNVTGTGDAASGGTFTGDYDQANYYSYQAMNMVLVGAGHNWQAETNPVWAANMHYDFVARTIQGGFTGQAGSLPGTLTVGSPVNYSFASYTVPLNYNVNNMSVHVLLIDVTNNLILNGKTWTGFPTDVAPVAPADGLSLEVFPNPAQHAATLRVNMVNANDVVLEVYDMTGKQVLNKTSRLATGKLFYEIQLGSFTNGLYNVKVTVDGQSIAKRLVVAK